MHEIRRVNNFPKVSKLSGSCALNVAARKEASKFFQFLRTVNVC